jgi:hypothetical protein
MPMLTASGRAFEPKCLAAGVMAEAVCLHKSLRDRIRILEAQLASQATETEPRASP